MLELYSQSRSPVVYSFVFKKGLCWSGIGHWLVKCWEMHIKRTHSWRAEQLANRMNILPQGYWELARELESTSTGGKIFFISFYNVCDIFQTAEAKAVKISRGCLVCLGATFQPHVRNHILLPGHIYQIQLKGICNELTSLKKLSLEDLFAVYTVRSEQLCILQPVWLG